MYYGSFFYILSVLFALLCVLVTWKILRPRSFKVQRITILAITLLNIFQHFFKPVLYPQYSEMGFSHLQTAYNVCALMIIISPAVYLWGTCFLRNFLYVIGTFAGIGTIILPIWFIGMDVSELGWEYGRYYICHLFLLLSSSLPLLLNHHRPGYRNFWHVGLGFLTALVFVLANNVILITSGYYAGVDSRDIFGALWDNNPCMMMGPYEPAPWVADLAVVFSPSVFLGNNPAGTYVPILWYAIPLYLGISFLSFILFAALDRKNLKADFRRLRKKLAR